MKKLEKKDVKDIYALTPMQEGLLFHYLQDPESELYIEQLTLDISGEIDVEIFKRAWNFVIQTNEMLRTVFRWENSENPVQIVLKEYKFQPGYYDFLNLAPQEKNVHVEALKVKERKIVSDLLQIPFRVTLCHLDKNRYEMSITNHHILYDGWSNGIILEEFFNAYTDLYNKRVFTVPLKSKFKEFIKYIKNQDKSNQEEFWKGVLGGFEARVGIPFKKRKGLGKKNKEKVYGVHGIKFTQHEKDELEAFIKTHRETFASLFYTAWGILLHKYTDSDDVIFGTTVSGRSAKVKGIGEMVGLFINTVPLRVKSNYNESILDLLKRVNNSLQVRENYENTSLLDIKEYIRWQYQGELFDSILVIENYPLDINRLQVAGPLVIHSYSMVEMTHYDLTVIIRLSHHVEIDFLYRSYLFDEAFIERLSQHFTHIIREMVNIPGKETHQVDMLSMEEKQKILIEFNNTDARYSGEKTLHQLFEEQAVLNPDDISLIGMESRGGYEEYEVYVTYNHLHWRTNQLAYLLREKGVRSDIIVGIMVERSLQMVSCILGILKAGGGYLPLDPGYPEERLNYMLTDSAASLLITTQDLSKKIRFEKEIIYPSQVINDVTAPHPFSFHPSPLPSSYPSQPFSLAYVIYTSGSTGKPKGVMVNHQSVVNILMALLKKYPFSHRDTYLLKTSYTFDVSVTELFGWFLGGGRLAVLEKGGEKDPNRILEKIARIGVTHINFVPSMFNVFVGELNRGKIWKLSGLRYIFLAGEALLPGLVNRFRNFDTRVALENIYGPTETTIYATQYSLGDWEGGNSIPIGYPFGNLKCYILDRCDRLQPIGVPGELCIGGIGLARGYLNQPGLTAEKFVEHMSYRSYKSYIYKTGDLALWLVDGDIEFLGRIDHQVKVRGFRIELGEIEARLLEHRNVKEAVVTAIEDVTGDYFLCAYVVSGMMPAFEVDQLRSFLLAKLPDYMVPTYFISIPAIPLTTTGKIDRSALPKPQVTRNKAYLSPRDKMEEKLAEIWSEVLNVEKEKIGIDDNFFEIGGHSLKVARLIGLIHRALNIEIPFKEIFKVPTIRGLSHYMREAGERIHQNIRWVEEKEYYPLAATQKRFYVFQQLNPEDVSYNMTEAMSLEGPLTREKFEPVFRQLIDRHESLRTSFHMVEGEPVQRVHPDVEFSIEYSDFTAGDKGNRRQTPVNRSDTHLSSVIHRLSSGYLRPYDLARAPLWRVGLVKISSNQHILMFDMHHLIADGTSLGIFIREFLLIYNHESLPPLKIRFRDYVEWQGQKRKNTREESLESPLVQELGDEMLNLPTDYPRSALPTFEGSIFSIKTEKKETKALIDFAINQDVTLFMVILAAYNILLSKLSGQENIAVGSPIAGRIHVDLDNMIGLFLNTLCLRNQPSHQKRFSGFLQEVKQVTVKAYEMQDVQYDELLEQAKFTRDSGGNPLFDVMLVLQNMELPEIEIPGLKVTREVGEYLTSKFDITLFCEERETLVFKWEYRTSLFKQETIQRFARYFKNIISQVIETPQKKIGDIEIIPGEEKQQILYDFNDTEDEYPRDKVIHRLFAEQAERIPDHIALVGQSAEHTTHNLEKRQAPGARSFAITYQELDEQSDMVAHRLTGKGVGPQTIVSVMLDRSIEMVIVILGILKTGGAYLPIIPDYPGNRINYILADSGSKALVTTRSLKENDQGKLLMGRITNVFIDDFEEVNHKEHKKLSCRRQSPALATGLAYIIYTSGSTGKPKGVMVEHTSVINLLFSLQKAYPLRNSDVYLLKTSFVFDVSVAELFGWFLEGGRLAIMEKDGEKNPIKMLDTIQHLGVTHINFVPSMFGVFVESLSIQNINQLASLKYIFLAGEALPPVQVEEFRRLDKKTKLENIYGPTEGTVYSSKYSLSAWKGPGSIPIGKPIHNVRLYILDKNDHLQPLGVYGELGIGGAGLARGYLNLPELTAEKFSRKNYHFPYSSLPPKSHHVIYKTGDLCRWLPDGCIEFSGRIDDQVKIRGFRIELREIESRLSSHENVKESLVCAKTENNGDKYLCAYIVPQDTEVFQEIELREYLAVELPDYMIPAYFVVLEKMPLNPNGKLDRKALPEPQRTTSSNYVPPGNEREKLLVKLWSDLLGIDSRGIGIYDNFFQLGGHSLRAAGLIGRIHQAFSVEISIAELFKIPTVKGISDYIEKARKNIYSLLRAVEKKDYYPLSSVQMRLFVIQRMDPMTITYNLPTVMQLEGRLGEKRFEAPLKKLINRHESLRTAFLSVNEEPVQKVHDENYKLQITNYKQITNSKLQIRNTIKNFVRPFDLSHAPLLRVGLIELTEEKQLLLLDMHHIISDGVSINIFIKEFTAFYQGEILPGSRLQYKDFSQWQRNYLVSDEMKAQAAFWQEQFEGETAVLNLPTDFPRPSQPQFMGKQINFDIGVEDTRGLKQLAVENGATLYMVLFSLYSLLLSKLSGQEEVVVGSATAGRPRHDLENIIGMFVNTMALRAEPSAGKRFSDYLTEVKEYLLKAFENKDYPYEELVEKVVNHRDLSRNPLFDTMLVLQNMEMHQPEVPGLRLTPWEYDVNISKFDLTLLGFETEKKLRFIIEYSTQLFKESTILRWINYFKNMLENVLGDSGQYLWEIEIIPGEERKQLLFDFNRTGSEYAQEKTIPQLFVEQVEIMPDRTALIGENPECKAHFGPINPCSEMQLTYKELNEKSNQLAYLLRQRGIMPDTIVGIMVERSIEMIIGILGVLKAGGAYMPITPDIPSRRIQLMWEDSGAPLLITQRGFHSKMSIPSGTIYLDDPGSYKGQGKKIAHLNKPGDLAYVIYTSGSTGVPKGVLVSHIGISNLKTFHRERFKITARDRVVQFAAITFDASVWEIFMALLNGAALNILNKEAVGNYRVFELLMGKHHVTVATLPPGYANHLDTGHLKSLRLLITAGSSSNADLVKKWSKNLRYVNAYGPTEVTICATTWISLSETYGSGIIPIGSPLNNTRVYILDTYMNIQPLGIVGQLYITGVGLARGYLNRPGLTSQKFLRGVQGGSFFKKRPPGSRRQKIYKTGDLARWLPEGNIEFLGRMDDQVKIRGFRIELGEVENQLLSHGSVKEAVVVVQQDDHKEKNICAYIVSDGKITTGELREFLFLHLPGYMVPSYWVMLEKMPLTPSGKVDRKSLPEPGPGKSEEEYAAPGNRVEEILVKIWGRILKARVGIDDNFFSVGGHSLKAVQVIADTQKELDTIIPLTEFFRTPTIRELSQYIQVINREQYAAVEIAEKKEYYPLSSAQKRMYLLQQMDLGSTAYHIPSVFILGGGLDRVKLENVFRQLIQRHESLSTSFHMINGEPVQRLQDKVAFEIEYHQVEVEVKVEEEGQRTEDRGQKTEDRSDIPLSSDFIRPFDLLHAPLLRVRVMELAAHEHILMMDLHHIVSDGISIEVFSREFLVLYGGEDLPPLRIQYKDYSQWQQGMKRSQSFASQKAYWFEEYSGDIPVLNLPIDFSRPLIQDFSGSSLKFEIGALEVTGINQLAITEGSTLYMVLLALFNIFLAKISGQENIIVGSPAAGRRHPDLQHLMGIFINTLALRNQPAGDKPVKTFLKEVKDKTLMAQENQDYPFEDLVEQLGVNRDASRNPIFDIMFTLQNVDTREVQIPGLKLTPYPYETELSKFDLSFVGVEKGGALFFEVEYSTKLFKKDTVERFIAYFKKAVSAVLGNRDGKIGEIEIIPVEEKQRLLFDFNDTNVEYPRDKVLYQLWEDQVEQGPEHIALVGEKIQNTNYKLHTTNNKQRGALRADFDAFGEVHLSYKKLNERAHRLALVLKERGVGFDTIVGIMVERSVEMIIGILGVLKAGGAYLPIDPDYPAGRLNFMLLDSNATILLSGVSEVSNVSAEIEVIDLNEIEFSEDFLTPPAHPVPYLPLTQPVLAYVIYTSGSTGKPKGVLIDHASVVNLAFSQMKYFDINRDDRILQFSSISFDASVEQIFIAFFSGAVLVLIDKDTLLNSSKFEEFVTTRSITHLHAVPSFLNNMRLTDAFDLRRLISGGDICSVALAKKWSRYCDFYNEYGPTETTVTSIEMKVKDVDEALPLLPIGRPVSNTFVYLFDKWMKLVPLGVHGELYIGGEGVARGYLNRPELTAEKFDRNLWNLQDYRDGYHRSYRSYKSYILYRTGDLARWLPEGNIEFLGRIDHQVKIRGFRVELGEIESRLLNHEEIKECVVTARTDENKDNYLCAYIAAARKFEISELRQYLRKSLPDYMIPSFFVFLDKMPLTPSRKLDRKALPAPDRKAAAGYMAPRNAIDEKLVGLWAEVFGIEKSEIGIDSNFFELGGHSLKATVLILKMQQVFDIKIPLAEIFKKPTIRDLATVISASGKEDFVQLEKVEKKEYYELSFNQKRLWVINQLEPENSAYNIPTRILLSHNVCEEHLKEVSHVIVKCHEGFRTGFKIVNDNPVQFIVEAVNVPFKKIDISSLSEKEKQEKRTQIYIEEINTPFDLTQMPLFRSVLIKLDEEQYEYIFNIHHIIFDGWSMETLKHEFYRLYDARKKGLACAVEPLAVQYKDYAAWQNRLLADEEKLAGVKEFWKNYLSGTLPVLDLPYDYLPGFVGIPNKKSSVYNFVIAEEITQGLRSFAREREGSLFMVLLASFNILLSHITGQKEILMAVPAAARQHWALKNIIGMFVNTLILRTRVNKDETFIDFFRSVQINTFDVLEYQDYPLELIFSELKMKYPKMPVFFNMINIGATHEERLTELKSYHIEDAHETKFEILCYLTEYKNGIQVSCHYFRELFKPETIEEIMALYTRILESISKTPGKKVKEYCISKKKKNILSGFKSGLKKKEERAKKQMNRKGDVTEALKELSKVNLDFLDYVEKNSGCFKKSNFRKLELNDDLFRLQPWPTFINRKTKARFQEASVKLFDLIKQIPARVFNYDLQKMSTYYKSPVEVLNLQMEGISQEHLDSLVSRGDFLLSSSGLKCIEYNVSPNLGGWQIPLWEFLYWNTPILERFFGEYNVKTKNENLLYLLLEHLFSAARSGLSDGDREINIAMITMESAIQGDIDIYFNQLYKELLNRKQDGFKGDLFICDYKDLSHIDGSIFYKDRKLHVLVELYNKLTSPKVMKAFKCGSIRLINGPITSLLSNKLNLALLSDHSYNGVFTDEEKKIIEAYVPWTRKVTPGPTTYKNEKIANFEHFIISNREKLVLKPSVGLGGEGVFVGLESSGKQWEEAVKIAIKEANWVVQEYVEPISGLYQLGENGCDLQDMVWGFFVFGSHYTGAWVRVMARESSKGVINCHQGASVSIIFEVDE